MARTRGGSVAVTLLTRDFARLAVTATTLQKIFHATSTVKSIAYAKWPVKIIPVNLTESAPLSLADLQTHATMEILRTERSAHRDSADAESWSMVLCQDYRTPSNRQNDTHPASVAIVDDTETDFLRSDSGF